MLRCLILLLMSPVLLALLLWWWLSQRPEDRAAPSAAPEPTAPPRTAEGPAPVAEPGPSKPDDLRRIGGIGPKISGVLQAAGITTFAQLAATDVGQLEHILREAGIRSAGSGTWPEQAGLAAAGQWETLKALQDKLKGGRRA